MHLSPTHHQVLQALADLSAEALTARDAYLPIWSLALSIGRDVTQIHTALVSLAQRGWILLLGTAPGQLMIGLTKQGEQQLSRQDRSPVRVTPAEQEVLDGLRMAFYPPEFTAALHSYPDTRIAQSAGLSEQLVRQVLRELGTLGYVALAIDDEGAHDAALLPAGQRIIS